MNDNLSSGGARFLYRCGSCGFDGSLTMAEMTVHWRSHLPRRGEFVRHTREQVEAELAPYWAERNAGFWPTDGWLDLIMETHRGLVVLNPDYRIAQVKEKFGGLRYYVDAPVTAEMRDWLRVKEDESYSVCQNCGCADGTIQMRHRGWYATLCSACDWDDSPRGYEFD